MADDSNIIELTIEVVSSFVGQNTMRAEEVPNFIAATHAAIKGLQSPAAPEVEEMLEAEHQAATTIRKSLASKDHIISMIDGKPYKTLRRHLTRHGLSPDEYRQRYKLPASYPMVAENYSTARREMAKSLGLGRKPKAAESDAGADAGAAAAAAAKPAPRKGTRGPGRPKAVRAEA